MTGTFCFLVVLPYCRNNNGNYFSELGIANQELRIRNRVKMLIYKIIYIEENRETSLKYSEVRNKFEHRANVLTVHWKVLVDRVHGNNCEQNRKGFPRKKSAGSAANKQNAGSSKGQLDAACNVARRDQSAANKEQTGNNTRYEANYAVLANVAKKAAEYEKCAYRYSKGVHCGCG